MYDEECAPILAHRQLYQQYKRVPVSGRSCDSPCVCHVEDAGDQVRLSGQLDSEEMAMTNGTLPPAFPVCPFLLSLLFLFFCPSLLLIGGIM